MIAIIRTFGSGKIETNVNNIIDIYPHDEKGKLCVNHITETGEVQTIADHVTFIPKK